MPRNRKANPLLREILAHNVRELRHEMNLSQEKLAELSNLHRTYIGAIERAERNTTQSTIEALSKALKVSPYELLIDKKERNEE